MTFDPWLLAKLVCPLTRRPLRYDAAAQELISDAAGLAYPIRDGVPIMLVDRARAVGDATATRPSSAAVTRPVADGD